jgi:hypothetical protein
MPVEHVADRHFWLILWLITLDQSQRLQRLFQLKRYAIRSRISIIS